jgi:PRTRC genetic system protein E
MNLFSTLQPALKTGNKITFSIEAAKDGNLAVLLIPHLGAEPEGMTPEMEQVRAALATPLRLVGSPAELDAELEVMLTSYNDIRADLAAEMDGLAKFKEVAKNAKKAAQKASTKAPASATPGSDDDDDDTPAEAKDAPVAPAPVSMVDASNPDSLF